MAFAKRSGWKLVSGAILKGKKQIRVIVGLNFGITDPDLLDEWLGLSNELPDRFEVRVAPRLPVFHPKVVIIRQVEGSIIAIVGSGNLTGGGQLHNVECGAFISRESDIRELETWYDGLKSVRLSRKIIEAYRPLYKYSAKQKQPTATLLRSLANALNEERSDWYVELFLEELADFVSSPRGNAALNGRINGARNIQQALRMPQFDFTRAGWLTFYGTSEFGAIRQTHPEMAEQIGALQKAFRFLIAKPLDEERFKAVFNRNGMHHVSGLGANQISKVLTVYDRGRWPLLNSRVWQTLSYYGYEVKWSALGYLEFAQRMRDCLGHIGEVDFWALDAFCESKSRELDLQS
jgi:hypothetical protein